MEKYFVCEICKCETPIECEGREPNTCADCMPPDIKFNALCERNGVKLKKLPQEFVIPPKTAQNKPKSPIGDEVDNILKRIKVFISQNAKLTLAPHGDFNIIISLDKLNNLFEKIEKGE